MYDLEGSILNRPSTMTLIRPINRIDFAQIRAIMCGKFPVRSKKDPAMAIMPNKMVTSTVQAIKNSVHRDETIGRCPRFDVSFFVVIVSPFFFHLILRLAIESDDSLINCVYLSGSNLNIKPFENGIHKLDDPVALLFRCIPDATAAYSLLRSKQQLADQLLGFKVDGKAERMAVCVFRLVRGKKDRFNRHPINAIDASCL